MQLVSADDQKAQQDARYQKLLDNLGAPLGLDFSGSRKHQALVIIEAWEASYAVEPVFVAIPTPVEEPAPVELTPAPPAPTDGPLPVGD
jgi:hypothetical protein